MTTRIEGTGALAQVIAGSVLCACLENPAIDATQTPVANAGPDQQIAYAGEPVQVTLDGSESFDRDGRIVRYVWLSEDGARDGGAGRSGPDPKNQVKPQLTLDQGVFRFALWVEDDDGHVSARDGVEVTVGEPAMEPTPETCIAGGDASACSACACEKCLSQVATCGMFEGGTLCTAVSDCTRRELAAGTCGLGLQGETSCYFDLAGTPGAGPCAAEINAAGANMAGADMTAVFGGACSAAPDDNACAAVTALGACTDLECVAECGAVAAADAGI